MRWARTLMIAEMLTKAIQSNVAHEARPSLKKSDKGDPMTDDQQPIAPQAAVANDPAASTAVEATPTTVPATTQAAVAATGTNSAATCSTPEVDVDARLHEAMTLAQMLTDSPKTHSFLSALLGIAEKDI